MSRPEVVSQKKNHCNRFPCISIDSRVFFFSGSNRRVHWTHRHLKESYGILC